MALALIFIRMAKMIACAPTEDMVAYANDAVFIQAWIVAEAAANARSVFAKRSTMLRHEMVLSDWQLDPALPPDTFTSAKVESAKRIAFAHPDPWAPNRFAPLPKVYAIQETMRRWP
jgi:hypothetical protein